MNRRRFLHCAVATSGMLMPALPLGGLRAQSAPGTLVVVFQRGGCDGLNVVVPYADEDYYSLRPTIAIPRPGRVGGALRLDDTFALHPRLTGLRPLYQRGELAILPAAHYPAAQRSHFASQDLVEAALGNPASGWLARYLGTTSPPTPRALSLDNETPLSLAGAKNVMAFNAAVAPYRLDAPEDARFLEDMAELYAEPPPVRASLGNVVRNGRQLWSQMGLFSQLTADVLPSNGASYPESDFGQRMRRAAQAIKAHVGIEVLTVNSVGWDTHSAQGGAGGRQADRLGDLGDTIAAFWQDLGADGHDVLVLCMTEFGRTAAENGSGGTDHGNAAAWLACGPTVRGGIYIGGGWPGLSPEQLYEGRDVAHTIDFRDVMAEVLSRHLHASGVGAIFPGHSPRNIGFL